MTTQTHWVERNFQFQHAPGLFPVVFSRLEGTIFRLHHLLANADDELCSKAQNGWSVKQHVGHLYDLEALWWQRLNDYESGLAVFMAGDITNAKTEAANYNETSLEKLANLFLIERQKFLERIYPFGEGELLQTAMHPRLQVPMRLIDSLYFIAEHDDHHLAAISTLLRIPIS